MTTKKPSVAVKVPASAKGGGGQKHARASKQIRHRAAVDETRERASESPNALSIETPDGVDELGEELGETFVEGVTGSDDAAMEHRADGTQEDDGGPFVVTTGATEFAHGTDGSNPADAEREALPMVSAPQAR